MLGVSQSVNAFSNPMTKICLIYLAIKWFLEKRNLTFIGSSSSFAPFSTPSANPWFTETETAYIYLHALEGVRTVRNEHWSQQ